MQSSRAVPLVFTILLAGSWSARAHATPPSERDASRNANPGENKDEVPSRDAETVRGGVLGGVGFPRPLVLEGFVKLKRVVGLGVEYSVLPAMTFSDVRTTIWALAGDVRVFPFRGAFFAGARAGRQHLGASASAAVPTVGTVSEAMTVDTWFVNPRLGYLWTWGPGLSLGIDAGVELPLSSSETSTLPPGTPVPDSVTTAKNTLGRSVLPTVDLLEIGLLF